MNGLDPEKARAPAESIQPASRWRTTIALLALVVGSSFFCRMSLNSLQGSMQEGMGLSDNQVALVQGSAMALAALLGGIPVGLLVDRLNRARLLSAFCFLNLLGTLATALSTDFTTLFLARTLVGFSTAAVGITVPSLLADLFPRTQRGRGSMIYGVSQVVGMAAAFATGGALVAILSPTDMWRSGLFVMSGPLLAAFLLTFLLREQKRQEVVLRTATLAESAVELWSFRKPFLPLLGGVVAIGVADGATVVWVVPTFLRAFHTSAGYANGVMGIALVVAGLLGPILGGLAADRCMNAGGVARAMTLLASLAAISTVLGLFALAPSAMPAGIGLAAFLLVGSMVNTVALTVLTVLLPNELRGFGAAVLSVVLILFSFGAAPSLVSGLAGEIGGEGSIGIALAIVCATTSAIAVAAFVFGRAWSAERKPELKPGAAQVAMH